MESQNTKTIQLPYDSCIVFLNEEHYLYTALSITKDIGLKEVSVVCVACKIPDRDDAIIIKIFKLDGIKESLIYQEETIDFNFKIHAEYTSEKGKTIGNNFKKGRRVGL
jgi:hypothetical protein